MALTKVSSGLISADASSVDLNIDAGTLYIDATNNRVGVGTTSPSQVLHLGGATNKGIQITTATSNAGYLAVYQDESIFGLNRDPSDGSFADIGKTAQFISLQSANGDGWIKFATTSTNNTEPTERVRITGAGNVGIGTSSPSSYYSNNLVVSCPSEGGITLASTTTSQGNNICFADGTTGTDRYDGYIAYVHGASPVMKFGVNGGTERMRIDSSGRVMINTTTPTNFQGDSSKLGIYDSTRATLSIQAGGYTNPQNAEIFLSGGIGDGGTRTEGWYIRGAGTGAGGNVQTVLDIIQSRADTDIVAARFDESGNLGIGTSSPGRKFTVEGGQIAHYHTANDSQILMYNNGTVGSISVTYGTTGSYLPLTFLTSDTERMRIDSSGGVRIGTTGIAFSAGEKASIINSAASGQGLGIKTITSTAQCLGLWNADNGGTRKFVDFAVSSGGAGVGSITSNGSTTAYNTTSDARLKDVTGSARGLEVINALNPIAYNWKVDGKSDEGLIAQEVLEIVPNAITQGDDDYYQMDYSKLVTHLVAGMKEQQVLIEQLQAEVALLKGE